MIDFLFDWFPWLAGGSTVALIAVAILAPSVLQVAGNWLSAMSPLIKGAAEFIVDVVKSLWDGFLDMTDNGKSLLFVGAVALGAYLWGLSHGLQKEPKVITKTVYKSCPTTDRRRTPPVPSKKTDPVEDWINDLFGIL